MENSYWKWLGQEFYNLFWNFIDFIRNPTTTLIISILATCFIIGWFGLGVRTPFTLFVLLMFFPITHSIYRHGKD